MRIEIVIPGRSPHYDRLITPLAEFIPGAQLCVGTPSDYADVVYYGNYGLTQPHSAPVVTLFTHREPEDHEHDGMRRLSEQWDRAIEYSDVCVAMSEAFLDRLPPNSPVIFPGIHPVVFTLDKLRVGVAGAEYIRNRYRKGYDLAERLAEEESDWLTVERTDGTLSTSRYAYWMRSLHAYVVTSRYEGGPMAAVEALAWGVPVVSSRVGFMDDLERLTRHMQTMRVLTYEPGDYDGLVRVLRDIKSERDAFARVFNLPRWINRHRDIFDELLDRRRQHTHD